MADRLGSNPFGSGLQETHGNEDEPVPLNTKSQQVTSTRNEKTCLPDDDDDEDLDALIDELESLDGRAVEEEESPVDPGGARTVREELLQTNPEYGLSDNEVTARRKKFGLNQMKEEKVNLVLKFLSYFVGPIQFVMEVCKSSHLGYYLVHANN